MLAPRDPRRLALDRQAETVLEYHRKELAARDRKRQLQIAELGGWLRRHHGNGIADPRRKEFEQYVAALTRGACCEECRSRLKQDEAWTGEVRAVLSTLTLPGSRPVVDRDGDVILTGSLDNHAAIVSEWNHSAWFGSDEPVGVAELFEDGDRLIGVVAYDSTREGRRACSRVLEGRPDWSVGYKVLKKREPTAAERSAGAKRIIQRWRVGEISPVERGAGVVQGTISACCGSCSTAA